MVVIISSDNLRIINKYVFGFLKSAYKCYTTIFTAAHTYGVDYIISKYDCVLYIHMPTNNISHVYLTIIMGVGKSF